jgi:hypothetical protein
MLRRYRIYLLVCIIIERLRFVWMLNCFAVKNKIYFAVLK